MDEARDDATEAVWAAVDRAVDRARRRYRLKADDADEFGQTVRAYVAEHLNRLLGLWARRAALDTYINAIVARRCVNWLRARSRARHRIASLDGTTEIESDAWIDAPPSGEPSPEQRLYGAELAVIAARVRQQMMQIVDGLPAYDRALVIAKFRDRKTIPAIAAARGAERRRPCPIIWQVSW